MLCECLISGFHICNACWNQRSHDHRTCQQFAIEARDWQIIMSYLLPVIWNTAMSHASHEVQKQLWVVAYNVRWFGTLCFGQDSKNSTKTSRLTVFNNLTWPPNSFWFSTRSSQTSNITAFRKQSTNATEHRSNFNKQVPVTWDYF